MFVRCAKPDIFPQDNQWGVSTSVYSHELARRMVWLSSMLPYEQCEAVFTVIGETTIAASSIWRQTQKHGQRIQAYVEQQRQQVSVERVVLPDARHDHDERKAISMDGGMVNIRDEGWRELKVGAVFDVESRLERNPQTKELEPMAHGVNVNYTAVLGTKDAFTPALWALAVEHQVPTSRNCSVVADGALWIWNVAEDVCPNGQQVVDWFHAVEHLSEAAHALYPDEADTAKRNRWFKTCKDHLYMGRIHKIIDALHRRDHGDLALYFERHQRRMQYLQFREEGLPIGSGTVESGVKQFKHRLAGTGMRWQAECAERMLILRAASLGQDFNTLWRTA